MTKANKEIANLLTNYTSEPVLRIGTWLERKEEKVQGPRTALKD